MRVLVYQAHPGQHHSHANHQMSAAVSDVADIEFCDLYALYPRHDIDVSAEQARLLKHDVIVFQVPFFWYSTPSIVKEWQDVVLEHGFAYGSGGNKLKGKIWAMALTCGAPESAYRSSGYNSFPLRSLLTPLEQTARLCQMRFIAPYVLYGALAKRKTEATQAHAQGWREWLIGLRDQKLNLAAADALGVVQAKDIAGLVQ